MPIEVDFDYREALVKLGGEADAIMNDAAATAQEVAQREAAVQTGALRRSVHIERVPAGFEVVSSEPYSVFLEYGTGVFHEGGGGANEPWVYTPDGGRHFYITSGQRAQPFMRPAYQAGKAYVETEGRRRFG